jgi:hypothetical protein
MGREKLEAAAENPTATEDSAANNRELLASLAHPASKLLQMDQRLQDAGSNWRISSTTQDALKLWKQFEPRE